MYPNLFEITAPATVNGRPLVLADLYETIADMEVLEKPKKYGGGLNVVADIDIDLVQHLVFKYRGNPIGLEESIREYMFEALCVEEFYGLARDGALHYQVRLMHNPDDMDIDLEFDTRFDSGTDILKAVLAWAKMLVEKILKADGLDDEPTAKEHMVLAVSGVANVITTHMFGLTYASGHHSRNDYAAVSDDPRRLSYVYRGSADSLDGGTLTPFMNLGDATDAIRCPSGKCMRCGGCAEHFSAND